MDWFVGVTTAPRGVNYLHTTIDNIKRAGWDDVKVFNDVDKSLGPWENLLRAIRSGLGSQADFIAVFQDDVEVTEGLRDWLEGGNLPMTDGIVSLWCRWSMDSGERGWREYEFDFITCNSGHRHPDPLLLGKRDRVCAEPGCKMPLPAPWYQAGGALGYIFRREVASEFLRTLPNVSGRNQSDFKVGQWCAERGKPLLFHEPSLVQHIGVCSATHGKRGDMPLDKHRVAKRFARNTTEIHHCDVDKRYSRIEDSPIVHRVCATAN